MTRPTVFEAMGGMPGVTALAEAWHARALADRIVSHAFSHGFAPDHTTRLAAYWAQALGGPPAFSAIGGAETAVVRMHSGNGVHPEMDERGIACFVAAVGDVGDAWPEDVNATLIDYFTWATATMSAYPHSADDVPDGLPLPTWDWDGPTSRPR